MSSFQERDALISAYSHLGKMGRGDEALHTLRKIASLVKPIMRARSWRVGTLAEFYPDQQNLLGINENRGQKICLRLRYPGDKNQFLPLEQVVDTMLHELCHNEIGPHNQQFHAMWDQLRKEYEGLLSKGYTGEGFLSDGKRLGGRRVPRHEARRLARIAAEKRQVMSAGSGQKLGGRAVPYGTDIRKVIVDAIERRNTVLKGCGETKMNNKEIKDLADQATQNGFKTQAEEDEANEAAIAQAMWELVQEDQKKEYGDLYIAPSAQNPTGNGGGNLSPEAIDEPFRHPLSSTRRPSHPNISSIGLGTTGQRPSHISRLVFENSNKKGKTTTKEPPKPSPAQNTAPPVPALTGWTCEICTLHNPIEFLCCDACTTERPDSVTNQITRDAQRKAAVARQAKPEPQLWTCSRCSTKMETQWWSCSTCGKVKESS
ncbi:hypothetical protein ACMFMG_000150 [Clarireedia jacksonii]